MCINFSFNEEFCDIIWEDMYSNTTSYVNCSSLESFGVVFHFRGYSIEKLYRSRNAVLEFQTGHSFSVGISSEWLLLSRTPVKKSIAWSGGDSAMHLNGKLALNETNFPEWPLTYS